MTSAKRNPRTELARLRHHAGLSQQQVATALGLRSVRAVSAWETGAYAPNVSQILPLARVLQVPVEEVVRAVADVDPGLAGEPSRPKGEADMTSDRRLAARRKPRVEGDQSDATESDLVFREVLHRLKLLSTELAVLAQQLEKARRTNAAAVGAGTESSGKEK